MKVSATGVIEFIRGDDDAMMIALKNIPFELGDKVYFSLKDKATDRVDLLQIMSTNFVTYNAIPNSAVLISIDHIHTIDLALRSYFYDILIEWSNGTYTTVITPKSFNLVAGGSHGAV